MSSEKELPRRNSTRLKGFDYSSAGVYFITICTEHRRQILSRIVGVDVLGDPKNIELLPHGMVADKYIKQMSGFYENITVDKYVIMPNHIHFLLWLCEDGSPRTSTPTKQTSAVSHFVSTFKSWTRFSRKPADPYRDPYHDRIQWTGWFQEPLSGRQVPKIRETIGNLPVEISSPQLCKSNSCHWLASLFLQFPCE